MARRKNAPRDSLRSAPRDLLRGVGLLTLPVQFVSVRAAKSGTHTGLSHGLSGPCRFRLRGIPCSPQQQRIHTAFQALGTWVAAIGDNPPNDSGILTKRMSVTYVDQTTDRSPD